MGACTCTSEQASHTAFGVPQTNLNAFVAGRETMEDEEEEGSGEEDKEEEASTMKRGRMASAGGGASARVMVNVNGEGQGEGNNRYKPKRKAVPKLECVQVHQCQTSSESLRRRAMAYSAKNNRANGDAAVAGPVAKAEVGGGDLRQKLESMCMGTGPVMRVAAERRI